MLKIGVLFWADEEPLQKVRAVKELGVDRGQLAIPGEYNLQNAAQTWRSAIKTEAFLLSTVVAAYQGEDYADIPTVEKTVGFIPESTRAAREQRTYAVSDFAAGLGVKSIACHVGFVPEDRTSALYIAVRDLVRRICDHAAGHNQTFALETGQEPANALLQFLNDVDRANLGINFDPANMILYGTGDPIEALGVLGKHVVSVHAKDGNWPPKDKPGSLGTEMPLGSGSVGIPQFISKLKEIQYSGQVNIEREGQTPEQWRKDVAAAVKYLIELI